MNEFKAMKFFVEGDLPLINRVCDILKSMGYNTEEYGYNPRTQILITYGGGEVDCYTTVSNPVYTFNNLDQYEEINIDWLRTPKQETIELNGKNYIKADVEAALEKLKPVGE